MADIVWDRFGDTANYVEPFAGSLAVLLARPSQPRIETVNDKDAFISNFWRAIRHAPDEVAKWADWPVNECDLHSRHSWLVRQAETMTARLLGDPEFYDAKVAGWWAWGLCSWIGGGWCSGKGPWVHDGETLADARQLPHLGDAGQGIRRKLPHLGDAGQGIHRKLPHLGNAGRGINRKLPHLGDAGRGAAIAAMFQELATRLRNVRVACGDWTRVLGDSVTTNHGFTAVFLDPPYTDGDDVYSAGGSGGELSAAVGEWAFANGDNPLLRIALCGYHGEHSMPAGWEMVRWKASGGYGNRSDGAGRANSKRETILFSPHCMKPMLL